MGHHVLGHMVVSTNQLAMWFECAFFTVLFDQFLRFSRDQTHLLG